MWTLIQPIISLTIFLVICDYIRLFSILWCTKVSIPVIFSDCIFQSPFVLKLNAQIETA